MWTHKDSCVYKLSTSLARPFLGFDFDDTLVHLRTSKLRPNVKETLTTLNKDFNLVIFSNQMGIQKNKTTHEKVRDTFDTFLETIDLPISVFYSTTADKYRKPNIGMYSLFQQLFHEDMQWYCGDACGRRRDFSNSDLYFANNCGVQCRTPENVFLSLENEISLVKRSELYAQDQWENGWNRNKTNLFKTTTPESLFLDEVFVLPTNKKPFVVMVGPQGSGKSLISTFLSAKFNLDCLSSDDIPSKPKLKRKLKELIASKTTSGIIIDNTNASIKNRQEWLSQIDETWIPVILVIHIPKPVSLHLTKYREMISNKHIPNVAVHSFYKRFEFPTENEGQILEIPFPVVPSSFRFNLRFT